MKRLALFAAVVLAVAACAKTGDKAADTTPAAMAPAPTMSDSMRKADSTKKADREEGGFNRAATTKTKARRRRGTKATARQTRRRRNRSRRVHGGRDHSRPLFFPAISTSGTPPALRPRA